jgi:2-oxoglutarate dehydrogenase E2 component (dihydrolipoamide succinyltransferase)
MPIELRVPTIGESITEVFIAAWLKQEGDAVAKDESVAELESDKATVELPAPVSGVLKGILKKQGESALIGEVIALIEEGVTAAAKPEAKAPVATATGIQQFQDSPSVEASSGMKVMPAAERLLAERGLDAEKVTPSGPGGRLLKEDVLRAKVSEPEFKAPALGPGSGSLGDAGSAREEEVIPMTPMRRTIANRLLDAQRNAALLTTFNEVDMSGVSALRSQFRESFQEKYGVKLGFMSFFVKAVVDALKMIPRLNAEIHGDDIVFHNYYDIGIAVSSKKGLVVPVLRNAERMSFAQIEMAIHDYGLRAQKNQIHLEELEGGTFTISNGGVFGSLLSTPIINPPQSGILGLHAIQDRPVVREGTIVIRPMMYTALTYDHRLVDGREAVTFLRRIKEVIEEPARMLIEV